MKKSGAAKKLNILISLSAVLAMWAVWIIAYYAVGNDFIIPSFGDTMKSFWCDCIVSARFWTVFASSILRTIIAVAISFVLAAVLAVPCALFKPVKAFVMPFMVFFRTLPTLAIILILLIWSNPYVAPAVVTALVIFPMIHSRLLAAIEGIDGGIKQMVKAYGIAKKKAVFKIYLPMIMPEILPQAGADISLALKITISAEVLANTFNSLGGMMQESKLYLLMPRLAALTICAVLVGLVIEYAFYLASRLTYKWSKKEGQDDKT